VFFVTVISRVAFASGPFSWNCTARRCVSTPPVAKYKSNRQKTAKVRIHVKTNPATRTRVNLRGVGGRAVSSFKSTSPMRIAFSGKVAGCDLRTSGSDAPPTSFEGRVEKWLDIMAAQCLPFYNMGRGEGEKESMQEIVNKREG
jgi:hypothetical protein